MTANRLSAFQRLVRDAGKARRYRTGSAALRVSCAWLLGVASCSPVNGDESAAPQLPVTESATTTLTLALRTTGLSDVTYQIHGGELSKPLTGSLEAAEDDRFLAAITGIPQGVGYELLLNASLNELHECAGTAEFDAPNDAPVHVAVTLNCEAAEPVPVPSLGV